MKNNIVCLVLSLLCCYSAIAQPTIKIVEQGRKTSIRGMSVVNDNIVWVSGSGGSVGKSIDGGKSWQWITVPGYEKRDFRDIEAFDENTAIIMGITLPAILLRTTDGGKTWNKVFEDTAQSAFFDAMSFKDTQHGFLVGDPSPLNQFYGVSTNDGGTTWQRNSSTFKVDSLFKGEAFFASSGTNIQYLPNGQIVAVSGGTNARLLSSFQQPMKLPIVQGQESTGANSIAIHKNKGFVVGGDFAKDSIAINNAAIIHFSKNKIRFSAPSTPPHGYRSCVIYINEKNLITCGTSGVDISKDGGKNWQLISKESFHVVQKARNGKAVFLAGGGGRIGKLESGIRN